MKRKLAIYAVLFALVVLFDWLKFIFVGGPNIVNWNSFAHPAWVGTTFIILLIVTFQPPRLPDGQGRQIISLAFLIHFLVFAISLLNQYLGFSQILTYNCMLWNLVFASMYYLLAEKKENCN